MEKKESPKKRLFFSHLNYMGNSLIEKFGNITVIK